MRRWITAMLLAATPLPAFGWGEAGHRVIGDLAWSQLTRPTRKTVRTLMREPGYRTLFATATWADRHARRDPAYDWAGRLHYVNAEPEADRFELDRDCPPREVVRGPRAACVVGAIRYYAKTLRDGAVPHEERVAALRWLAHFVGDVHQPLHVAHPDGRGGNRTFVLFYGENRSLHWVWDHGLPAKRLERIAPSAGKGPAWRRWSAELAETIGAAERRAWAELDPVVWATESLRLARTHTYRIADGEPLAAAYERETRTVLERRLQQAGTRLALLLNSIFDPPAN